MREFLDKLGIKFPGRYEDNGDYVVDIENSNDYSKVYSILDKSNEIHELEDDSVFDVEKNTLNYEAEKYDITLQADLEGDEYKLIISEKEDD